MVGIRPYLLQATHLYLDSQGHTISQPGMNHTAEDPGDEQVRTETESSTFN